MTENHSTEERHRKTYEKPVIRDIDLVADEVLGIGCKTQTGGYAFGGPTCLMPTQCFQSGS